MSWLLNGYLYSEKHSEYTLSLKVGVCIMATEALGVLAHVAALGARLRRGDQPGEHTLVATNGSL